MSKDLPDYDSEPNEWESNRTYAFPRHIEVQIKQFTGRIQLAHTLGALAYIRNDIERGVLANNAHAKEQLKRSANQKAQELGAKGRWWS